MSAPAGGRPAPYNLRYAAFPYRQDVFAKSSIVRIAIARSELMVEDQVGVWMLELNLTWSRLPVSSISNKKFSGGSHGTLPQLTDNHQKHPRLPDENEPGIRIGELDQPVMKQ